MDYYRYEIVVLVMTTHAVVMAAVTQFQEFWIGWNYESYYQ